MKPKRILLVRHGESAANVDPLVYSNTPDHLIHLTEAGCAQAREAGAKIAALIGDESFGVYASPYVRTLETKEGLLRFPDGESCADVYDRMCVFFESLFRQFDRPDSPENIVIVSHGTAIKCFLMRWHHWTVEKFETLTAMGNCEMAVIQS